MRLGDAFDLVVQRYGGFVLLLIGALAIGVAAAGYYRYLPQPFAAPIFPPHCLGCRQLTGLSSFFLYLGIVCLTFAPAAIPHNRRNRQAARGSA